MTQPEAQNKIDDNDSIKALHLDINSLDRIIESNRSPQVLDGLYYRLNILVNDLHAKVYTFIEDKIEEDDNTKRVQKIEKRLVFWSLLALFLVLADINIGAPEPEQNSGAVFGIVISNLNKDKVIIGFLVFLFILYLRWAWIILKISITFRDIYTPARYAIEREISIHKKAYNSLMRHAKIWKVEQTLDDAKISKKLDSLAKTIYYRDAISKFEKAFRFVITLFLTLMTAVVAGLSINDTWSDQVEYFILAFIVISVLAVLLPLAKISSQYASRKE